MSALSKRRHVAALQSFGLLTTMVLLELTANERIPPWLVRTQTTDRMGKPWRLESSPEHLI